MVGVENPFLRRGQKNRNDNKFGHKAESFAMKSHGAQEHVGSGGIDGLKSDGSTKKLRFESKATTKQSFSVKLSVLEKIRKEAIAMDQEPVLTVAFVYENGRTKPHGDFVMISRQLFNELIEGHDEK